MRKRGVVGPAFAMLLIGIAFGQWRLMGQRVNLVVVNASGQPIEIAWQPQPFAETVSVSKPGCNSTSMDLQAGDRWRVARDGETILDSSALSVPMLASRVAVEVWLDPDGSVRIVPAHEVTMRQGAPYPPCENAGQGG